MPGQASEEKDPEAQPLLAEQEVATPRYFEHGPIEDAMTYQAQLLTTWSVFMYAGLPAAIKKPRTWFIMLRLMLLSTFIAIVLVATVPEPARIQSSKFQVIGTFLRIFVGLLLGFFMSSSVQRWYTCTNGFLELFDAVRNLQMQFIALGVPEERSQTCIRYGLLSAVLLSAELKCKALESEDMEAFMNKFWKSLQPTGRKEQGHAWLLPREMDKLKRIEEPASLLWIWVASLVGRMAQDGDIPAMPTPTYGRIMNLAQAAHGGIRQVKASISVMAPFIYVHMLASLVHINNIINAISFGIAMGSAIGTILSSSPTLSKAVNYRHQASFADVIMDSENFTVNLFINIVGPLLYQALLDVSICIAEPFSSAEGAIPCGRLIQNLEKDLREGKLLGDAPPSWDPPHFKEKKSTA